MSKIVKSGFTLLLAFMLFVSSFTNGVAETKFSKATQRTIQTVKTDDNKATQETIQTIKTDDNKATQETIQTIKTDEDKGNTFHVTLKSDNFEQTIEVPEGTTLTNRINRPTKTGYIFSGRYLNNKLFSLKTPITGDITLNAKWRPITYTISFSGNASDVNGLPIKSILAQYDSEYTIPSDANKITRTGYELAGWNSQPNGNGLSYTQSSILRNLTTKNGDKTTLYAQWTPIKYTITFNTDGGTTITPITGYYGDIIKYPTNPTKTCYSFSGWDKLPTTMPAEDITLTAIWNYTCHNGGGSGSTASTGNNIYLETNNSNPNVNEYINLTVKTDNNYVGNLTLSAEYQSPESSTWTSISSNTSSTYFSDYSTEWSNGRFQIKASDHGEVTLEDLVQFKKAGYYKIFVEDVSITFNVTGDTSENEPIEKNIEISINPDHPESNEWINLTITTDDYDTNVFVFGLEYRDNSLSSRNEINNLSNTHIDDYSSTWKDGFYITNYSDYGESTLEKLIKFKKPGYYRIYVGDLDMDDANIIDETYIEFYVKDSDNRTNNENILSGISNLLPEKDNEVYKCRSCKSYEIQYIEDLDVYTSPHLKTKEYFINKDYFKRYIDSKNSQNAECIITGGWISTPYTDSSESSSRYVAPNGKVYFIEAEDGLYTSEELSTPQFFKTIDKLKNYIKENNPLSSITISGTSTTHNSTSEDNTDETYTSRSCKLYTIEYIDSLDVYSSNDLKKKEYFVNKDYFKRYIDSKNSQNDGCPVNGGRVSTSYTDDSESSNRYTAPNGKVYFIRTQDGLYTSDELNTTLTFSTIDELKKYIKNNNPLPLM